MSECLTRRCKVCDTIFDYTNVRRWIAINRVTIGSGQSQIMTEGWNLEGEYVWDMEENVASGPVICWPDCFSLWMELKMAEGDIGTGKVK